MIAPDPAHPSSEGTSLSASADRAMPGAAPRSGSAQARREADEPSPGAVRFMMGLLWFGVVATIAYWVIWFGVNRAWLATADTPAYYAFENAFPLSDAWMAATGMLAALALQRRRSSALLWMLLTGSATLYLGGMDVLFDWENGIYVHGDPGNVAVEALINVLCLAGGSAVVVFAWRHRRYFVARG